VGAVFNRLFEYIRINS